MVFKEVENKMIDGTSMGEAAILIKLNRIIYRKRGLMSSPVRESSTISHHDAGGITTQRKAEKGSRTLSPEPNALRLRIFSRTTGITYDRARNEKTIVRRVLKMLMRKIVILVRSSTCTYSILSEVICWIDEIEAIGEQKLHAATDRLRSRSIDTSKFERARTSFVVH